MNLVTLFVRFLKNAHVFWTELLILVPVAIVSYLFFPDVEYTAKLIVGASLCSVIVISHIGLGGYSFTKRDCLSFVNFVILPISASTLLLVMGYR